MCIRCCNIFVTVTVVAKPPRGTLIEKCNFIGGRSKIKCLLGDSYMEHARFFVLRAPLLRKVITRKHDFRFSFGTRVRAKLYSLATDSDCDGNYLKFIKTNTQAYTSQTHGLTHTLFRCNDTTNSCCTAVRIFPDKISPICVPTRTDV